MTRKIDRYHLWYLYVPDSRRLPYRGWPDLTIVGVRGVLVREVKTRRDVLRPMQRWIANRLLAAHLDWGVWTADDLASGRVDAELAAIAHPDAL